MGREVNVFGWFPKGSLITVFHKIGYRYRSLLIGTVYGLRLRSSKSTRCVFYGVGSGFSD